MLPSDGGPSTAEDLSAWRDRASDDAGTSAAITAPDAPVFTPPVPFARMSLRALRVWKQLAHGEVAQAVGRGTTAGMVLTAERGGGTTMMRALIRATLVRLEGRPQAAPDTGSEAVAWARRSLGYSQGEFAAEAGVSSSMVHRWEHGLSTPSPKNIETLRKRTGLDLSKWFPEAAPAPRRIHLRILKSEPAQTGEREPEAAPEEGDDDHDDDAGEPGDASAPVARKGGGAHRRAAPRARTLSIKRLSKRDLARGAMEYPEAEMAAYYAERPKTRGDCLAGGINAARPCPWVSCKQHLALDVNAATGSIKTNFPDTEVWEMKHTCALDVADAEGTTLEAVGEIMNLTRERIRQVETQGLAKLRMMDTNVAAKLIDCLDDPGRVLDAAASDVGGGGAAVPHEDFARVESRAASYDLVVLW